MGDWSLSQLLIVKTQDWFYNAAKCEDTDIPLRQQCNCYKKIKTQVHHIIPICKYITNNQCENPILKNLYSFLLVSVCALIGRFSRLDFWWRVQSAVLGINYHQSHGIN